MQYIEYHKILAKIDKRINKELDQVGDIYTKYFPCHELTDSFKKGSVKQFINKLNIFIICESMEVACSKLQGSKQFYQTGIAAHEAAVKYFCGICWNKIKENG